MGRAGSSFVLGRDLSALSIPSEESVLTCRHCKPLYHAVVRVAINLGLLEYLSEAGSDGRTNGEIMTHTGVDELLLRECPSMVGPSAASY